MNQLGDMDADTFRRHGHHLVEWVADYLSHSARYPVLSRVQPGDVRRALPEVAPAEGEAFDEILADFERVILPGVTHWNHPGFFAYFAITGSAPGVLAELLTAALNVQAMVWKTSPAATELEEVALGWLRQLLGLPSAFEGVIYDTASVATLHALAAARGAAAPEVRERGLAGRSDLPPLCVYCSEHAHSSIDKATILLGMGHTTLRKIPVDEEFRMQPDALRSAIAGTGQPACSLLRSWPPSARRRRRAWILCARWRRFVRPNGSGCMWTRPTQVWPPWYRAWRGSSTGATGPTRSS